MVELDIQLIFNLVSLISLIMGGVIGIFVILGIITLRKWIKLKIEILKIKIMKEK